MTHHDHAQYRPTLWRALAGYALWAVCLTALYTGHALACRYGDASGNIAMLHASPMSGTISWSLAIAWLVFIAGNVLLALQSRGRWHKARSQPAPTLCASRRLALVTTALDISAVAATVVTGLPILLVRACAV